MDFRLSSYHQYRRHYASKLEGLSKEPVTQATLVLIFSLLTVSFFAIFAIKPTLVTIAELIRTIKDKKTVSYQLQDKIEALSTAQINYEKIKPHLTKIEKLMPQEVLFLRLVSEINLLAWENQVVLESGKFGDFILIRKGGELIIEREKEESEEATASASENKLSELVFTLNVGGEYKNLKEFVKSLNKIDRLVVIEGITFDTGEEEKGTSLVIDLKVRAFYLNNGKT